MSCPGVLSVRGLQVVATGWVFVGDDHVVRPELKKLLELKGARFNTNFQTTATDLVVMGDYRPHQIQNDRVGGVDALDQLWRMRQRRGRHVHLVHHIDLVDLFAGDRVPCRHIPKEWLAFKKFKKTSIWRGQQGT